MKLVDLIESLEELGEKLGPDAEVLTRDRDGEPEEVIAEVCILTRSGSLLATNDADEESPRGRRVVVLS